MLSQLRFDDVRALILAASTAIDNIRWLSLDSAFDLVINYLPPLNY